MKPYNKSNIPLAKKLRKDMTPWERHLWYDFLRYYPIRFQRQKAIGEYIVDFYCAKAGLVIELDGGGHYEPEQMRADRIRTEKLENMNLQVLRICKLDVDKNFAGVCEYIDLAVQERLPLMREVPRRGGGRERSLPQSAALTAPSSEGALESCNPDRVVYALGFFDGVHLGHQALLTACSSLAGRYGCSAGVVTFDTHPETLVTGNAPLLINTVQERQRILLGYGISQITVLPFDKQLMQLPWQAFLEMLVDQGACGFVCGEDFRFGNRGEGNAEKLAAFCKERGLLCKIIGEQTLDGIRVSSTHIRACIEQGRMEAAVRFLGHPHVLTGMVVEGKQLGRTIGIPTANLLLPEGIVCPAFGVYACKAIVDGTQYLAVTNVGIRPTVSGEGVTVEPWLLDFDGDLYGKTLVLYFYSFLRPEMRFDSLDALAAEIRRNADQTRQLLG